MKNGSVPDKDADYWDKKKEIETHIKSLKEQLAKVEQIAETFPAEEVKVE